MVIIFYESVLCLCGYNILRFIEMFNIYIYIYRGLVIIHCALNSLSRFKNESHHMIMHDFPIYIYSTNVCKSV